MYILGIETSCDDTGIGIYGDQGLVAHTLYSQIKLHQGYGGTVPELASREHIIRIKPLIDFHIQISPPYLIQEAQALQARF